MSSPIFSIVTGVEWEKVHDVEGLFAAAAAAGIDRKEVESGMREWEEGVWFVRVEVTRRIPKVRPSRVKAEKADTPEARAGRIFNLACQYAAIPAAFDDRMDSDYSPLDD